MKTLRHGIENKNEIDYDNFDVGNWLEDATSEDIEKIIKAMTESRILGNDLNAGIERNYICIDKIIDGMTYRVIPLPSQYGILALTAVHNSIGHSSAAQLYKHTVRYFQFEKMRDKVKQFVSNCVKCTLLRGGVGYQKIEMRWSGPL